MSEALEAARRHDDAFNAKDPEARKESVTPNIESVLPGGLNLRGPEEVAQVVASFWEALPDARVTWDNHIATESVVVTEGHLTGTHTGTFRTPQGEIPPSGNQVNLRYASIKWVEGGKIAAENLYFDQLEFLQQLGAMPEPPAPR